MKTLCVRNRCIVLLTIVTFIASCGLYSSIPSVQVSPESQMAIAKITARRVGYEIAKSYPVIAKEVLAITKAIDIEEKPDIIAIVVGRLGVVLSSKLDDPLLEADIQDLLVLIEVKVDVEITENQMAFIKVVSEGLTSGISIGEREINERRS